ncbi:hypothetical protein BaRGS_00020873 [Batillaria attramentaria]|uniref:Uncharacterized protein n=1 Tax=Batillaria attramentaria TaxID=370345 RepID=A0ABD0KKS2_9CAEN
MYRHKLKNPRLTRPFDETVQSLSYPVRIVSLSALTEIRKSRRGSLETERQNYKASRKETPLYTTNDRVPACVKQRFLSVMSANGKKWILSVPETVALNALSLVRR